MQYSEVMASLRRDGARFAADVPPDWLQGRTAFGGLQAALGLAAMRQAGGITSPLRVLQVSFIAPVPGGPVALEARTLRQGKNVTQAEARLLDASGGTACTLTGIFGAPRSSALRVLPRMPDIGRTAAEVVQAPHVPGFSPEFTRYFGFKWAEGVPVFGGQQGTRTRIYIRHEEPGLRLDDAALVALADAIPSPALSMLSKLALASSLTWTFELLAPVPAVASEAWWRIDTEVEAAADGYVNMSGWLYAPSGEAAALTRQSVVVFG